MMQTRREFMEMLAMAGLGLVAGSACARHPGIASYFKNASASRSIGSEYLTAAPGEHDAVRLTSLITEDNAAFEGVSESRMRELLGNAIRRDFENSRTVKIHGWIFSLTEARICALASITVS